MPQSSHPVRTLMGTETLSPELARSVRRALYSVIEVRELERRAESEAGCGSMILMERAGTEALRFIRNRWPAVRHLGILAGPGNNGGDGFALALEAIAAGYTVRVWTVGSQPVGPGRAMARRLEANPVCVPFGVNGIDDSREPELWVDALLGIGLNRPPDGLLLAAIDRLNRASAPILSLDIPSGLDGDTGWAPGGGAAVVRATATITYLCLKRGLFTGVASQYVGRSLELARLGLPAEWLARSNPSAHLMDVDDLGSFLLPRSRASHKGDWGHLLIAGGGIGFGGAVRLVAEGALRTGAGLVSVVTRPEHVGALIATRPEAMVHGTSSGRIPDALLERATLGVIGCGLGQDRWGRRLWGQMMEWSKPLIVDADGLNLLARSPSRRGDWLLTPHPGEAARLLGVQIEDIEKNRFDACASLVDRFQADVVLKGAGTLVSGSPLAVCPFGNPGMASGGMGDFLSGIIGGLGAQGLPLARAGALGVLVHALAGDDAAHSGERGLLASDLASFVRARINPHEKTG